MINYIPVAILAVVFVLIAVRQTGGLDLKIWHIVLAGAVLSLLTGSITPEQAFEAVNFDVIVFLAGMFLVGEALERSGYLYRVFFSIFKRAASIDSLVLYILFVTGFLSAIIMNDTVAVIGTPLVLHLASRHNISIKPLLLALCFAITTGSVLSPIGNPQNLMIALGAPVADPFVTFLKYLAVPTAINLFAAYLALKVFYPREFHKDAPVHECAPVKDAGLALLSKISLCIIALTVIVKIADTAFGTGLDFRLTWIAVLAAAPILLGKRRWELAKGMDWPTLVFFAALFVLMEAVWRSGVVQGWALGSGADFSSNGVIIGASVLLSQVLSNVPFVALYLPVIRDGASVEAMMALAAGSTIAGNLFILGAASNVIVIQNAERRGHTLTFAEFAAIGLPLTLINAFVYWIFLSI